MVKRDDSGQLFTIEGIVAGLIMLSTAFIVMGSVNIYTPGDAHISDMQLQQLGSDALLMLDTPDEPETDSELQEIVTKLAAGNTAGAQTDFSNAFEDELKRGTGTTDIINSINYNATVYYRDIGSGDVMNYALGESGSEISRQPAISTGRFVLAEMGGNNRIFWVEVRLWRE